MADTAAAAPRRSSLGRLFSWALIGQGSYAVGQWALLVLIAKLLPGPLAERAADSWVFALALCGPAVLLTQADLRVVLSADAQADFGTRSYLQLRAIGVALMLAFVCGVGGLLSSDPQAWAVVCGLALARGVEGFVDIAYAHYQRSERQDLQARSQILRTVLGTSLAALALWQWHSVAAMVLGLVLAWVLVLGLHDWPAMRRYRFEAAPTSRSLLPAESSTPSATPLRRLARHVLPLGLVAALISLNSNLPRYVLERLAPQGTLGVFGSVAYVLVALALMNQALRGATLPRFAAHWTRREYAAAGRILAGTLAVAVLPGLALAGIATAWGGQLLVLLYNDSFAGHGELLMWLSLAGIAGGVTGCLRAALTAVGEIRSQLGVTALAVAVTGLCAWAWVPNAPFLGAAFAVLVGRVVMGGVHAVVLWRAWHHAQ